MAAFQPYRPPPVFEANVHMSLVFLPVHSEDPKERGHFAEFINSLSEALSERISRLRSRGEDSARYRVPEAFGKDSMSWGVLLPHFWHSVTVKSEPGSDTSYSVSITAEDQRALRSPDAFNKCAHQAHQTAVQLHLRLHSEVTKLADENPTNASTRDFWYDQAKSVLEKIKQEHGAEHMSKSVYFSTIDLHHFSNPRRDLAVGGVFPSDTKPRLIHVPQGTPSRMLSIPRIDTAVGGRRSHSRPGDAATPSSSNKYTADDDPSTFGLMTPSQGPWLTEEKRISHVPCLEDIEFSEVLKRRGLKLQDISISDTRKPQEVASTWYSTGGGSNSRAATGEQSTVTDPEGEALNSADMEMARAMGGLSLF